MSYSILIVDDDVTFCEELSEILSEYRISTAQTPSAALSILEAPNELDLVLLDVRLPKMKGTELLKIIKDRYPEVLVIIMTGYGSKEVVITSMRNQADDFIEKPLEPVEIIGMVQRHLMAKRGAREYSRDIDYIKHYIRKNIDKNVELEDLAEIMGYSVKYMSRFFKQEAGMNFNEYRLELKMDRAKELLEKSDYRIKHIAYEIGYENSESFVRIFKKRTELTPSQYRKKVQSTAGQAG